MCKGEHSLRVRATEVARKQRGQLNHVSRRRRRVARNGSPFNAEDNYIDPMPSLT